MIITLARPRYYNSTWMPSPYRLLLLSQAEAFSYYQSQYRVPQL